MKQPPEPKPPEAENASTDETDARAYRVTLPMFEGPLDLLLHLIQKHELDILQIPIAFVAQKYVEYIRLMEDLSIDIASEYLVMAATLAYIKSRSLLPPDPSQAVDEDNPEEEEDPRAELIRKLLEYQKYKHAADNLGQRELLGRDVFPRGFAPEHNEDEAPLAPMSLFKLMDAFEGILKRAKQVQEHQIDFEKVSISDRIGQIVDRLRAHGTLQFVQLFDGDVTRVEMVVTFLALLEMTKLRITRLAQDGPLMPITVELALGPGELHEFEVQRTLGETPSVMQKIDSWDESRVEIPTVQPTELGLADDVPLDEQALANFQLTPEELGDDAEWAQDVIWAEGGEPTPLLDVEDVEDDWADESHPIAAAASEETASEETASEETASEETASEETASEEPASEETASEETASEETASEETDISALGVVAVETARFEPGFPPLAGGSEELAPLPHPEPSVAPTDTAGPDVNTVSTEAGTEGTVTSEVDNTLMREPELPTDPMSSTQGLEHAKEV
jgi:segregation and condensation protein A